MALQARQSWSAQNVGVWASLPDMVCRTGPWKGRYCGGAVHNRGSLVQRLRNPYIVAPTSSAITTAAREIMPSTIHLSFTAAWLTLAAALAGCSDNQNHAAAPPPTAVTVAKPVQRSIVDQDEYVGRFVAVDMVEIRSRLSGYLSRIHFQDGQMVKEGDLLFTIDRRPFQIALDQARANLELAKANLAFAESDLARGQELLRNKTITEQTFEQRTQAKRVAQASVAAQEALVHSAELDFNEFTELRAPVAGRIGDRRVSVGNLVTGGTSGTTTLLATIVSIDPIRFEFTFDEAAYLRYQRLAKGGSEDLTSPGTTTPVKIKLIDEHDFVHDGRMDFVDNAIDRATGTIRGRAQFGNPDGLFTPGMFANIRVPASLPYNALLVPDVAIGSEQARKYVLVVDNENVARPKYVTLGEVAGGLRVVKDGLAPDDRVVTNGIAKVRPGQKVTPQEEGAPSSAPAKPQASAD
jgi:multidrug efflux system membrane fusion protein